MIRTKMTLKRLKEEVDHLDPNMEKESETYRAYVVLLASAFVGPDVDKLVKFTKYDRAEIKTMAGRLKKSKVWKNGKVYADWRGKDSGIALAMDVGVALGLIERQ